MQEKRFAAYMDARCTIDFLLSAMPMLPKWLFRKGLGATSNRQPRVINTDLALIYNAAIAAIKKEGVLAVAAAIDRVQYLNNILKQDHRAIKRRLNAKQGYKTMHMIRKGQVRWMRAKNVRSQIRLIGKLFGLAT